MRKRVPLIFDQSTQAWRVDLPTYRMIPDSVLPVVPNKTDANGVFNGILPNDPALAALSCQVELPDDTPMLPGGAIDAGAMQKKYKDHPRFGQPSWVPPALT